MGQNSFRRDSELGSLMPNLLGNSQRQGESLGTTEIRQYMNAAYNIPSSARRSSVLPIDSLVTPAGKVVSKRLSMAMNKAMNEASPMAGRGTARKFCIRIKKDTLHDPTPAALRESQLDPEELKDALLQQAVAQRRALVTRSLRKGSGRDIKRPKYELKITLEEPTKMRQPDLISMTSSQQAAAQSPFTFRPAKQLSPMEGIPERLVDSANVRPNVLNIATASATSAPLSPMEGIPEFSAIPAAPVVPKARSPSVDAMPPPPPVDMGYDANNNDDYGAMDDYGDDCGGDYGDDDVPLWNEPLPGRVSEQVIAPKRKRIVLNPGIRLRNELPRKSLAVDITVGRQEIAPGLRRSTRRAQEPLRWWLGEKKQFDRVRHKTMPTISAVMIADPSSPWKTVDDPIGARQDKYKDPKHEKKSKAKVKARRRANEAKPVKLPEDEMSDEETVLVGSPRKISEPEVSGEAIKEATLDQIDEDNATEAKREEDEDTLVINNRNSQDGISLELPIAASLDRSDMTVPLGQRAGATPTSKNAMGIILEADGSCGSVDNTDELEEHGDDDDDEIIIPGATPQVTSKAPAVSETMVLPRMSPFGATEIQSSTPTSAKENDSPKVDSVLLPEPSLNHMQDPDCEKQSTIPDEYVESPQKHRQENQKQIEQMTEETGHDKENAGDGSEPASPLKQKSPLQEAPRRSARNRAHPRA